MATMKEVAARAHVSVATVSRVVNKTGYVSPDLEVRVYHAMRELKYQPSALARSLRRQETLTVGLMVPQVDLPFFGILAFAIEKALFAQHYRALICSTEEDTQKENVYIEMLIRQRVDGVIMVPTGQSTEALEQLIESGVPVVLVDRDLAIDGVSKVLVNNYSGGYAGMKHLIELGHRRISLIGAPAISQSIIQRAAGARQALHEAGLEPAGEYYQPSVADQYTFGREGCAALMQSPERPTAIFALTDVAAVGVIHAADQLGLRVPHDLSVMGFDNIPMAQFILPALTTVAQPIHTIGEAAATSVLRLMQNRTLPPESHVLDTRLIVRQSTAAPR